MKGEILTVFIMYDLKMNKIQFLDGFIPLDIFISSIEKQRQISQIEGSHRKNDYGSIYTERDVLLSVLLDSSDTQDYRLLRDDTYSFFNKHNSFYVTETYQPGMRYLVAVDSKYIPQRIKGNHRYASVEINCTKLGVPFAESIGTTQDIEQNGGITYDSELWSYGMGLLHDDESQKYTHKSIEFSIYNAGSAEIHPFEQYLIINVDDVVNGYTLTNQTTGDVFKYTGSNSGNLILNGPNITLNNLQCFRDTNRKCITLKPGWNHFTQNQLRTVGFDFRFYYQ